MHITRRAFAFGSVAFGAFAAKASINLGGMQIDIVSDGSLVLPADFIMGANPPAEITAILAAHEIGRASCRERV